MILHAFPDLDWLKRKIDDRFRDRRGVRDLPLPGEGFPNVVIHAKSRSAWRPDIIGPISLFMNLKGRSRCGVDGRMVAIGEDHFFLTNRFQPYTLAIDERVETETFNVHIGEEFSEGVLGALLTPADTILNDGLQQKAVTVAFANRLYRRDATVEALLRRLRAANDGEGFCRERFEEGVVDLLYYLLAQHRDALDQLHRLPVLKTTTRIEIYRRLSAALDYLHTATHPDVDTMARIACLSKFHFLRLFRQAYGRTPYQYAQSLRLEKACHLLKHTSRSVIDISTELGFENPQSFSRLFAQRHQVYPSQYRAGIK
jgi:AraC family transcriptional regulator